MPKYTIKSSHLIGFAGEKGEAGKTVKVYTKTKLCTSDEPVFHVWMKHITGIFFPEDKFPTVLIHKFLIVLHPNDEADVYINDFIETARVQIIKGVKAGDKVYVNNISKITDLNFPDIEIKTDDAIIYAVRNEWRFSLYFDFGRQLDLELLSKELGALKEDAAFYSSLASTNAQSVLTELNRAKALIFTEGKTDWKHLSKATEKLNIQIDLAFFDDDTDGGSDDLYKMCEHYAALPQRIPMIFVFDRDEEAILKKLKAKDKDGKSFQAWGNNVYSLYLPIPKDRTEQTHAICIELFYKDNEIIRKDAEGRRLFLSNEFNKITGNHNSEPVACTNRNKINHTKVGIIDSGVFDRANKSVGLSKDDFAEAINKNVHNFDDFDFSEFKSIFNTIEEIINLKVPEVKD